MDKIEQISESCKIIAETLAKLLPEIQKIKDLTDGVRDDPTMRAANAATALFMVKGAHDAVDAAKKAIYKPKDFLDKVIVPEKMEADGVDQVRVPSIARSFSVQDKMSASFVDKEAGFEWLRGLGQGDMITETVNAGTLTAYVRNLILEEGIDPPEDVVKVSQYKATGMNKYMPK